MTAAAPLPPPIYARPSGSVVLFILDDLSVEEANFMPGTLRRRYTPTIDSLAAQSLVLNNFHSVAPLCTPSRYTMFTGNFASRATNRSFLDRMALEGVPSVEYNVGITSLENTLPKQLKALGVHTGFFGKEHMTDKAGSPVPRDSSIYDSGVASLVERDQRYLESVMKGIGFDESGRLSRGNPIENPVKELRVHNLDWIADGAVQFIDRNRKKNFFLVVSLSIPHVPLEPDVSWNSDPRITAEGILPTVPTVMPARSTLTARVNIAGYPGTENLLWADDAVAAVMSALQRNALMDKASIFLMSDHGMSPKATIYRGSTKTPALVKHRGVKGVSNALTATVDLAPTIVSMYGGKYAGDGVDMAPLFDATPSPLRSSLYIELGYARAVIDDRYEYIAIRNSPYMTAIAQSKGYSLTPLLVSTGPSGLELASLSKFPYALDRDQLYDLQADPKQQKNLFGNSAYSAILSNLQNAMKAQKAKLPGSFVVN